MRFLVLLALAACRNGDDTTDTSDTPLDADGDGVVAADDCNDADATVHPGAAETCNGVDDDCDEAIDDEATDAPTWYSDGDGDGYGGADKSLTACDAPLNYVSADGDCDDADPAVHPGAEETDCADPTDYNCDGATGFTDGDGDGAPACQDCDDAAAAVNPSATEACNAVDDDCDGEIDEAGATGEGTFYADADADGHGDAAVTASACATPTGYVETGDDCDDGDGAVHPGADELCDGEDDDCDGATDEDASDAATFYRDADGDGHGTSGDTKAACAAPEGYVASADDCDDAKATVHGGATEACDGLDSDCDGAVPTDEADGDGDGARICAGDCDDANPKAKPGLDEVCDAADNDCDGQTDESPTDGATFYADADSDGFGDAAKTEIACAAPPGFVDDDSDCDDADADVNPDAAEVCDGDDTDCSGTADDHEAVGGGQSCAAADCVAVRDDYGTDAPDGVYWVDPSGAEPFEAYCLHSVDGGGWLLVWKNHGGAKGGEKSNQALHAEPGVALVEPYEGSLVSAKHEKAWSFYYDAPDREWLKLTSLWKADDSLVSDRQHFRVDMGKVTMKEIFSQPVNPCNVASDTVEVFLGGKSIGKTNYLNHYAGSTFGLANSGHPGETDDCGQPTSNLINDGSAIVRIDGGNGLNSIRHLFSYTHTSAGRDASRCLYACWDGTSQGGHYDAFVWAVR